MVYGSSEFPQDEGTPITRPVLVNRHRDLQLDFHRIKIREEVLLLSFKEGIKEQNTRQGSK